MIVGDACRSDVQFSMMHGITKVKHNTKLDCDRMQMQN